MVSSFVTDPATSTPASGTQIVIPSTPLRVRPKAIADSPARDPYELSDPYESPPAGQRRLSAPVLDHLSSSPGQSSRRRRLREAEGISDDGTDTAARSGQPGTTNDFCEQLLDLARVEYERLEIEANRLFEEKVVLEKTLTRTKEHLNMRHDQFHRQNTYLKQMGADRRQRNLPLDDPWYNLKRNEHTTVFDDIRDYTRILRQQSTAMSRLQGEIRKCDDDGEWMLGVRLLTELARSDEELARDWVRDTFREVEEWVRRERMRTLVPASQ